MRNANRVSALTASARSSPGASVKPIGPVIQPWKGLPRMRTPKRRTISPVNAPTGYAVALEVHDDRLGPLRAGDELEPLARLEDIAPPLRFDGGFDPIQWNSLQAKHRLERRSSNRALAR